MVFFFFKLNKWFCCAARLASHWSTQGPSSVLKRKADELKHSFIKFNFQGSLFLPGKFHGWRSLVGYGPWGHKELDRAEWLRFLSFYSSFWRKKWKPTPVLLPGESHGWRGLVGYSLCRVCVESDMPKQLTHTQHIRWAPLVAQW